MFFKIAKKLSVITSLTGILMMAGACSVKQQELFYLYAALGLATFATGAFAGEYFKLQEKVQRRKKRREALEYEREAA